MLPDPAFVLNGRRLCAVDESARDLFGVDDAVSGSPLSLLFAESPSLADRYAEATTDVFVHREETDLVHGSGVRLWLNRTVVEESDGDVSFGTDENGTTVQLVLPAA